MKADRRHELKENELAAYLRSTRDYLDQHGKQIGIGAVVVLGVLAAITFAMRARATAIEDVWRRRSALAFDSFDTGKKSLETLESLSKELSDRSFVFSALVDQGQRALRLAQQAPLPPDRESNQKARQAFEELRTRFSENPLAIGAALSGLASVEENEFVLDGDLKHKEVVRDYLNRMVQDSRLNGMPYQKMALDRLKALDPTFTKVTIAPPPAPPPSASEVTDSATEEPKVEAVEHP